MTTIAAQGTGVVATSTSVATSQGPWPIPRIEFAPWADPLDPDPYASWVDITTKVRSWSSERGRQHELDDFETGTATITVDNRDGSFMPDFPGSQYAGAIVPKTPFRIREEWNGKVYPIIAGHIDVYQPYDSQFGKDSLVEMHCTEIQGMLTLTPIDQPFDEAETDQRALQVCQLVGIPLVYDPGVLSVEAETEVQTDALSHLQAVAQTEVGFLYADASGRMTFHSRPWRAVNKQTSSGTFGDSPGVELGFADIQKSMDEANLWNVITINYGDGQSVVVRDQESIDRYGARARPAIDTLNVDASEAQNTAGALLAKFSQPRLRVDQISLNTQGYNAAVVAAQLGLDISDHVTVNRRPGWAPGVATSTHKPTGLHVGTASSASTVQTFEAYIEKISHSQKPGEPVMTTWMLSPADPAPTTVWVIGVSRIGIDTFVA